MDTIKIKLDGDNKRVLLVTAVALVALFVLLQGLQAAFADNPLAEAVVLVVLLVAVAAAVIVSLTRYVARREQADYERAFDELMAAYRENGSRKKLIEGYAHLLDGNFSLELRLQMMKQVACQLIDEGHEKDARKVVALMGQRNFLKDGQRKFEAAKAEVEAHRAAAARS